MGDGELGERGMNFCPDRRTSNLSIQMTDLAERANMVGFAMFARGDLHDQGIPTSIESRGALKFFRDVFQKSPEDVLALFEMWAVTKNKGNESFSSEGQN